MVDFNRREGRREGGGREEGGRREGGRREGRGEGREGRREGRGEGRGGEKRGEGRREEDRRGWKQICMVEECAVLSVRIWTITTTSLSAFLESEAIQESYIPCIIVFL